MAKKTIEPETASTATTAPDSPTPTKRGRKAKVIDDAATAEPIAAPTEPRPPKAKKCPTLADAFAGYLRSLEESGKSDGTIFSYRLELSTAGAELGVDTKLADLTPERVLQFFTSDRVTKTRSGRAKSPLSIDKTRRVVRQALAWAEKAGWRISRLDLLADGPRSSPIQHLVNLF